MDKFFSFFGKLAIILLVVGLLVGGGYYLGTGKLPVPTNPAPGAVMTTAPAPSDEASPTLPPFTPTPSITTQQVSVTSVSGTSFGGYTIQIPVTWTVKKEETPGVSAKLTISRNGYAMNFYQAATGGTECVYPGQSGGEMSTTFGPFVTLHDASGTEFRRATPTGSANAFTICQKGDSGFGLPTTYGHAGYTTPANPDPAILQEMDAIFATIKKS